MSDPVLLQNPDLAGASKLFDPKAEQPVVGDQMFEARQYLKDYLTDQTFQQQVDNTNRTVDLFTKIRPDLTRQQVIDNLPGLYESLTGQKHVQGLNPLERVGQAVDMTLKSAEADMKFWMDQKQAALTGSLGATADYLGLTGPARAVTEQAKVNRVGNAKDTAKQVSSLDLAVRKVQVSSGGPWWLPIVDNATNLATSVGQMAGEAAVGTVVAGPVGGALGAWDASSRLMAASSYRTIRERGVDHDLADQAATVIGFAAGAVDLLELGTMAGIALKPIVKKAAMGAVPAIARALAINLGKAATATAVGTAEEVAQEGIAITGENLAYRAQNDRTLTGLGAVRGPLYDAILAGISDYNASSLVPLDTPEDIASRLADTAVQSAIGMATLGVFGGALGTGHTLATLKEWDKAGVAREKIQAVTQDVQAEKAIQAAEPVDLSTVAVPIKSEVVDSKGELISVFHPADQGLAAGRADISRYGNGLAFYTDKGKAETESRAMSTGPLDSQAFLQTVRSKYPQVLADAAEAVATKGREAEAPFAEALKAWEAENPTMDAGQILDLAESIYSGKPLENRNELVRQYGLEAALPSGGIVEAKLKANKVSHVDTEDQIGQAFKDGADAVEFDGTWFVKDPNAVVVIAKTDSMVETAAKNPVGKMSFQANDGTLRALSEDGREVGRVRVGVIGNAVQLRDLATTPEFRRQGVARALVERIQSQHPGKTIDWGTVATPEALAFQTRIRQALPTWDKWGSRVRQAEAEGDQVKAEFFRQKADTIPDPSALLTETKALDQDQLQKILSKGMSFEEAQAAIAIMERMAWSAGSDLDTLLARAVDSVQWVGAVTDDKGTAHQGKNGAAVLAASGRRMIQLVQGRANITTVLHEMAHVLRPLLTPEDQAALLAWTGEAGWSKEAEERFARGFEQYLGEGHKIGDDKIDAILQKLASWFRMIYEALFEDPAFTVGGKKVALTDEARAKFKKILEGRRGPDVLPEFGAPRAFVEPLFQGDDFGPSFEEFKGNPAGAIAKIMEERKGQVIGATERADLGPIDFVYGKPGDPKRDFAGGFGLSHIAAKHGVEMLQKIPALLRDGTAYVKADQMGRVLIRSNSDWAFIKLEWEGKSKTWLVTAFEKTQTDKPHASQSQRSGWRILPTGFRNSIDPAGKDVKTDTLFQDDLATAETRLADNEAKVADFVARRDSILERWSKGKTSDEKKALEKTVDVYIETLTKANQADRASIEAMKSAPKVSRDAVRREVIQAAVAQNKPIPDAWLDEFKNESWARAEIDRRMDLRDQIVQARSFDNLEDYLNSVIEDRVLDLLGDPFQATAEREQMIRSGVYLTPDEHDRLARLYAIAHAKTPEQLDKEFADGLTPARVERILGGMATEGYIADKALPRHVLAQVTKSHEGGQTNAAEIPRILKTMKNDPRTYRRIEQQIDGDMAELESLSMEEEIARRLKEVDAENAPPEIKAVEIPSDLNIEDAARIRLGTETRMYWQRQALDADKEHSNLERAMEILERLSDRWSEKGDAVQTGENELADLEALAVLGQVQYQKLRSRLREFSKEAGGDRTQTRDRVVVLISDLTKHIRGMAKAKEAARRAYAAQAEEMRKMGAYLSRSAPKTISVEFATKIELNRALIDPHFRTLKKVELLALEAEWYRKHPEIVVPRNRRGELYGKNLNLWTYQELYAAYQERKAIEDAGRADMISKKMVTEDRRYNLRQQILDVVYNEGAILQSKIKAAEAAGDTVERERLADKYLRWEMKRAENLRNLNEDKAARFNRGGAAYFLTISNLADMLDGGADYKGINHQLLWSEPNAAENRYLAETDRRKVKLFSWVKENKIELGRLKDRFLIDGVEIEFSADALMTVYVGQKNQRKAMALRFGNRIDQRVFDFVNKDPEMAWVRSLGDRIIQEYDENKDRLFDIAAEYDNIDLRAQEEENYTPMARTEINLEGMDSQLQWEAGAASAVRAANIEHKFTESRIDIGEDHQKPIKLGEFTQWLDMVGRQEQYIAYTPIVKDLKALYTTSEVKEAIVQTHGKSVQQQIDNYIKSLANRYYDKTFTPLDRIMAKLSGNAALAFMAYNIATVLKQFSSLPLFIAHTRPDLLLASMLKMANPVSLVKKVDGLSIQMKTRIGYTELDDLRLGGNPAGGGKNEFTTAVKKGLNVAENAMHRIADPGMKPMQWADKLVASAGWDAAYETAKAQGAVEEKAVEYADWVVGKTQQSTHAKDTAGVMRDNNSLVKAMTLFAGPSVKVYNELVYGTRSNLKNKHWLKSFGTLLGISTSALVFYGIGKGSPPEDEEWYQWVLLGMLNQVPIAGGGAAGLFQGYDSGNLILNQAIESAFNTGKPLAVALDEAESQAKRDAAWPKVYKGALDAFGLGLGAPVSPVKRVWKTIETGNPGELVGWHQK